MQEHQLSGHNHTLLTTSQIHAQRGAEETRRGMQALVMHYTRSQHMYWEEAHL